MKVEARLFLAVCAFCWAAAIVYGFWTKSSQHHVEVVGVAALILSGGLLGIPGRRRAASTTSRWSASRR